MAELAFQTPENPGSNPVSCNSYENVNNEKYDGDGQHWLKGLNLNSQILFYSTTMDFISGYCRFAPSIIIYERYKIWKMPSSLSLFLKESKGWAAAAAAAATDACSHLKMKNLLFTAAFWKNKLKNAKKWFFVSHVLHFSFFFSPVANLLPLSKMSQTRPLFFQFCSFHDSMTNTDSFN